MLLLDHAAMTNWWQALNLPSQIFWGIAICATLLQLLVFASSMFGGHDFDHAPDGQPDGGLDGVKFVSVRAIIAFFVGFGWAGALGLSEGLTTAMATVAALVTGFLFMGAIFAVMRFMVSLKHDGTLDYQNALNLSAKVYVTIPPKRSGEGQVEILLQGRLTTVHAITDADHALAPQSGVRVTGIESGNRLLVTPT